MPAIPATFHTEQGQLILELHQQRGLFARLAEGPQLSASGAFSEAQCLCIGHLMRLGREDFHATLADALEPGELRDWLQARHALLLHRQALRHLDPPG
jgi:hypothetical protein